MIVTIDGPAASGKSTSAKLLADKLKFLYLDTGAMYRCIALSVIKDQIDIHNEQSLGDFMIKFKLELITKDGVSGYLVNGDNVSKEIRSSFVSKKVSEISAIPVIREYMVKKQRDFAKNTNCVVEGRDIGTVVFPEATIKFFMIASVEVRAKRRQLDLQKIGEEVAFEDLKEDIATRDRYDSERSHSPLKKAFNAIEIDTTNMTLEQQLDVMIRNVNLKNK